MTELSVELLDRTLPEESAKKSGLLWARIADGSDRPLWQVWHDGAVVVVGEGQEQPLHGLAAGQTTQLTARSKDKGGRLVSWPVRVEELAPGSPEWTAAAEELRAKRLNSPDHAHVLERWARESRLLRLVLTDGPVTGPGALSADSHAVAPVPTPATTRSPVPAGLPKLLFSRKRRQPKGEAPKR